MKITKDLIINDDDFNKIYAKLLLGDFVVARARFPKDFDWYIIFNMEENGYCTENYFLERNASVEIILNIDLNRIIEPEGHGLVNLEFIEDKNDVTRMIYGPYNFSKDYIIKLFKNQFNIEIK